MQLFSFEKKFQTITNLKLNRILTQDSRGNVYTIKNRNLVVKIVPYSNKNNRDNDVKILKYLQKQNNASVVKVHSIGKFTDNKEYFYYYIMDKLRPLPRKRRGWVSQIDGALGYNEPLNKLVSLKVKRFVRNAKKLKYTHYDIHEYNIMLTKQGALKFIDLESFMI